MRLVGYIRVSTTAQAEEGLGLEVQEQALRAWAKSEGHRLVAIHRDEGISGSNGLDTRLGLGDALALIEEGKAEGLVVYRLDRLARDLVLQEQLLADLRRMGGRLFSTSAAEQGYVDDDDSDPSRAMIRQILGAVNAYERSMIALRLKAGRARKAANGGYAYGPPPLGYRAEGGELVRDDSEQETLERIAELRRAGKSLREIARALDEQGIPTKRGGPWQSRVLSDIVKRLGVMPLEVAK